MKSSISRIFVASAILAAGATAQQKQALQNQLNTLAQQASAAKLAGNHVRYTELRNRYDAVSASLGGDQAMLPSQMGALAPVQTGTPHAVVQPGNCFGTPGVTYPAFPGTTGPLPDVVTSNFTSLVAGVANPIWDVDMSVSITHTWNADLDIFLTSPMATVCEISTDNGGSFDNVFNGTLFDDQSANNVTTYAYVNLVAAPDLRPEASMNNAFRGENANGTWTLSITDDAGADVGNLSAWSLVITDGTLTVPPAPTGFDVPVTFSKSPNLAILDVTINSDTQTVGGLGTSLWDVDLYTQITHTWNSDLEISLVSPAGTSVMISDNWGGSNDDVFNGTLFDESSANAIATYVFTNGVAAPDLNPDGNLTGYYPCGEDPNGLWTLIIADQAGGDVGNLARWDLTITTAQFGCSSGVTSYCTSSTTTNNCNPTIAANSGVASIAAGPGSFILTCSNVEGQKSGLIFYGTAGQNNIPWASGSTSFLCVKAPTQRMQTQSSGGTPAACDGTLVQDFFNYVVNLNPGALGNSGGAPVAGTTYDSQAWFRDPPAPKTTNLSNGVQFTLCP